MKSVEKNVEEEKQNQKNIVSQIAKTMTTKILLETKDCLLIGDKIYKKIQDIFRDHKQKLELLVTKLEKSNPLTILKAGYSKVMVNEKVVSSVQDVRVDDVLTTYVKDGKIISKTISVEGDK